MKIQNIIYVVFPVLVLYFIIQFIISYNSSDSNEKCNILCGGVGSVYKDDGKCLCDCPEGYTGESCEFVKPGYYRTGDGTVARTKKCENRHRKYTASPASEYIDTRCEKCPDGFYADGDECKKCTDCDAQDGKYFIQKCLNNADAKCGNQSCGDGQYYDTSSKLCTDHTICDLYASKGTQSYDAKCATSCLVDEFVSGQVCTKCTTCDPMTEIEKLACTNDQDRVCEKCPPGHYVEDGECVPSKCPDGWWYDGVKCRRCVNCKGAGYVYEKTCGVANNAKCAKRCPYGGYYMRKDLDGNYVCERCTTCNENEFKVSDCEEWTGGEEKETSDTVCVPKGYVGYPYAESKCTSCKMGRMNPDFRFKPDNAYRRCQSNNRCVSNLDCNVTTEQTGKCDPNGFCEMHPTFYCGGSGKCDTDKHVCSSLPSYYYPSLEEGGVDDFFPPEMLPSNNYNQVAKGKLKLKLNTSGGGSLDYESKSRYDWGDTCYVNEDESHNCVMNLSYMEEFDEMVCNPSHVEYNQAVCDALGENSFIECAGNGSCIA